MNDESVKFYELLGVAPGASAQELKTAHRDLAKVWHPDRFAHDPRLQQKAQEKLKEINEAYDELISGKTGRRSSSSRAQPQTTQPDTHTRRRAHGDERKSWLLPFSAFMVLFIAASFVLISYGRRNAQSNAPNSEQAAEEAAAAAAPSRQADDEARQPAVETSRSKRSPGAVTARETVSASVDAPPGNEAKVVRPMPTVTVTIDPSTGMLATAACPNKSRMTYPDGSEPHQYCTAHQQSATPSQTESPGSKKSGLKSFIKRHLPG